MSARMRLWWFGAVAFVAIMGIGNLVIWIDESLRGPSWWAIDFTSYDAARRLLDGSPLYSDQKLLYPPLTAVVGIPLLVLDRLSASLLQAAAKVALAVVCVRWLTPGWRVADRALAVVGVVTSLPFLHDIFLGNTNVFVVGALVPALFGRSRRRNGVLVGLAAAAFAKPLFIPVLIWLAIWRRDTFLAAVVAGIVATAAAIALLGPGAYADWIAADGLKSDALSAPFVGNHGVTAIAPALWLPVAIVTGILLLVVLARGGPRTGLAWAVTAGVLMAPYAGTYAALPIALALPALGPLAPLLALIIVAVSPIATTHPLPFYAAAIMVAVVLLREPRAPAAVGLPPMGATVPVSET